MANVFIGWSGNQPLALCLEKLINSDEHEAIVGGGTPRDMYVGAQVINQINQCSYAILLVENISDEGAISNNLMFEWGYIMAKLPHTCIYTMLIDKESRDLPSDLQGTWVSPIARTAPDGTRKADEVLAFEIYNKFKGEFDSAQSKSDLFDVINGWKRVFSNLIEKRVNDEIKKIKYILLGCYAAYYYTDNEDLREVLDEISGSPMLNDVVDFAKAYIDVFLYSDNMTRPISRRQFRGLCEVYRDTLDRKRCLDKELDLFMDILCYNAFSLAYVFYLRNDDFDDETRADYADIALEYLADIENTLEKFEEVRQDECLSLLIKSYLYNDRSHIYRDYVQNEDELKSNLLKSVDSRRELYRAFKRNYPSNRFLTTKFDQEYMVALSDLCYYIEDKRERRAYIEDISDRFEDWEKEISYSTSLLKRIRHNLKRIGVDMGDSF